MAHEWYWRQDGVTNGPAEIDDLADLYHRSALPPTTLVWRTSEDQGLPLEDTLSGLGKLPPPLPVVPTEIASRDVSVPLPAFLAATPETTLPSQVRDPQGWTDTSPHPWRRYFARMMDTTINGALTFFAIGLASTLFEGDAFQRLVAFLQANRLADSFATLIGAIPLNALVIGLTGTSFGKWFFGIRVLGLDAKPIGFIHAFLREISVWFKGFALGIPLLSLFALVSAYGAVKNTGSASWDTEGTRKSIVLHRPSGAKTVGLAVVGVVLWLFVFLLLRSL